VEALLPLPKLNVAGSIPVTRFSNPFAGLRKASRFVVQIRPE